MILRFLLSMCMIDMGEEWRVVVSSAHRVCMGRCAVNQPDWWVMLDTVNKQGG